MTDRPPTRSQHFWIALVYLRGLFENGVWETPRTWRLRMAMAHLRLIFR